MESWSFGPEGKGFMFTDEMDIPIDAFARSRKGLIGWDINNGLMSDREAVESMEYMDLGFSEMTKKTFHSNTTVGVINGEIGSESSKRVTSPTMITSNLSFGKEESSSKLSSSLMESNSQDSSLIDLKLGRLVDCKDLKERTVISTVHPSLAAKRTRTSSYSQTPFCQVLGCNMDLSSSKDYHKRHKVCEVHTKTPKVIVNGIEQRFCQQCSRFHLLVEFDDGKRSCRKRLAGHNARRRKPQFTTLSGKPHKLLESYPGTKFLATSLPKRTPFVFPDILAGGILYPERYDQANWNRDVKLGEKSIHGPQLAIPITNGQLLPKSFLHLHGNDKQYSPGIPPSATEDYAVFDTAPSVQELSGVSHSNCALSLLSAKSQDLSSHSAGIPMAMPLISQTSRANHSVGQISDKTLGISSSEKYTPNGFYSSGMNSLEVDQMASIMVSNAGHAVDCEVQADGSFQESDFLNVKYCLSPEHGSTVDLLQLSSHLQRVEHQRNSIQVKQEDLCYFLTT